MLTSQKVVTAYNSHRAYKMTLKCHQDNFFSNNILKCNIYTCQAIEPSSNEESTTEEIEDVNFVDKIMGSFAKIPKAFTDTSTNLFEGVQDKFKNILNLNLFDEVCSIDIDGLYKLFSEIKPINLCNLIGQFCFAKNHSERFATISAFFELYNFFWTPDLTASRQLVTFAVMDIIMSLRHSIYDDMYFSQDKIEFDENSNLQKFFNFIGVNTDSMSSTTMAIIGAVCVGFFAITGDFSKKICDFSMKKLINRVNLFSKSVSSITSLQEKLPALWISVMENLARLLGFKYTPEDTEVDKFHQDLLAFKEETHKLLMLVQHNPQELFLQPQALLKIQSSMKDLDKLYETLLRQKKNMSATKGVFDDIKKMVKTLDDYAETQKHANIRKIEPFFLMFAGKPGVGKSQAINYVVKELGKKMDKQLSTYPRNSADKYFSGYAGQDMIIYDDWGIDKLDTDHKDLMLLKNPNRVLLNMSSDNEKGRPFTSVGILAASNQTEVTSSATVKTVEAIVRRLEIMITVNDPTYDDFISKHKCSPGDWEKRNPGQRATTVTLEGDEIPYFTEDFSHLQFFHHADKDPKAYPTEVTLDQVVDIAYGYYLHYLGAFMTSFTTIEQGAVTADLFNECDNLSRCSSEESIVSKISSTRKRDRVEDLFKKNLDHEISQEKQRREHVKLRTALLKGEIESKTFLEKTKQNVEPQPSTSKLPPMPTFAEVPCLQKGKKKYAKKSTFKAQNPLKEEILNNAVKPQVCKDHPNDACNCVLEDNILSKTTELFDCSKELATVILQEAGCRYVNQAKEEVESSANSFVDLTQKRGKIFAFVGAPGTGKSTAMNNIVSLLGADCQKIHATALKDFVPNKQIIAIEDISITKEAFYKAIELINPIYDGDHPVKALLISFNVELLNSYFTTKDMQNLFYRRLDISQFSYRRKSKNLFSKDTYYNYTDVTSKEKSFCEVVEVFHHPTNQHYLVEQIIDKVVAECLEQKKVESIIINRSVPYISKEQIKPEFKVTFTTSMYEACRVLYTDPSKMVLWLMNGTAKLTLGTFKDATKIAGSFSGANGTRPEFPETIDEFIKMINNSRLISQHRFACLISAEDNELYFCPKQNDPHVVRCFKVCEKLDYTNMVFSDGQFSQVTHMTVNEEYSNVLSKTEVLATNLTTSIEECADGLEAQQVVNNLMKENTPLRFITSMSLFVWKLFSAGFSIASLLKMHFKNRKYAEFYENYKNGFACEGRLKKKNKSRGLTSDYFKQLYDELQKMKMRGSSAAKQADLRDILRSYRNQHGDFDYDEICDESDFHQFLSTYNDESKGDKAQKAPRPELETDFMLYTFEDLSKKTQEREVEIKKIVVEEQEKKKVEEISDEGEYVNEALLDPQVNDFVNLGVQNTVEIGTMKDGVFSRRVYGLMCHERIGVTVHHVHSDEQTLWAKTFNTSPVRTFPIKVVKKNANTDFLMFQLPKQANSYTSIVKHFPTTKIHLSDNIHNKQAILTTVERTETSIPKVLMRNIHLTAVKAIISDHGSIDGLNYTGVFSGVETRGLVNTKEGDCGSFIVMNSTSTPFRIVGIHNAAKLCKGHSTMIFQEHFKDVSYTSEMAPECVIQKLKHTDFTIRKTTPDRYCGFPAMGVSPTSFFQPIKSKLWTSPLALNVEPQFEPAILSENDPRNERNVNPYFHSVMKWNHVQPIIDLDLLDECVADIGEWYATKIKHAQRTTKILTKTEAINAGKDYNIQPINRQSSAGFPYFKYGKSKGHFFVNKSSKHCAYYGIDLESAHGQLLNNSIDDIINICKVPGQKPACIFSGFLKDEPVKMKKIFDVNTRSFAGAPLDYTIAHRMYFSTILGAMHDVRDSMPIQIGIDPTSLEWDGLVKHLKSVSDLGFDLDFKGFDATVPAVFMQKLVHVYNTIAKKTDPDWTQEHDQIRIGLHDVVYKPLLALPYGGKSCIVQSPGGQVSGQPGTADDNSVVHLLYLLYAFKTIMRENEKPDLANIQTFIRMVCAKVYGDDGVYAISPEIIQIFNFRSVNAVLKKLNIECTPASKTDKIVDYFPILDFEFLKRDTVKLGSKFFGKLKIASLEKMLGYCNGPAHHWARETQVKKWQNQDLIDTANSCLRESIFHGIEVYNEYREHIITSMENIQLYWFPPNYNDLIEIMAVPIPRSMASLTQ